MKRFHVLFASVLVVALLFALAPVTQAKKAAPAPSIVDIVVSNPDIDGDGSGDFSVLLAAVQAADPAVAATLSGKGQYTVFAPTDAAFVSLLSELGLTAPELLGDQALVTEVLLYHVAHGRRDAADVVSSDRIRTLQRGFLMQDGGVLTDNNGRTSTIVATDVPASNGIVHVIDTVVLP